MIVTIVGWYGTETSGDRAILDGILSVLEQVDRTAQVKLGSLFPFYSRRTLLEEKEVFKKNAPDVDIELFDIKERRELSAAIEKSDLLILGGGPLMDLEELYLIDSAFSIAKKREIPAVVMGCGIGPLKEDKYIRVVGRILEKAAKISLRDELSGQTLEKLWPKRFSYECLGDPAIISVENFLRNFPKEKKDYLAVNFRDFPGEQYGEGSSVNLQDIAKMLDDLATGFEKILLIPMHTFHVGNDDRRILAQLKMFCKSESIEVIHRPLNLHELYEIYGNAKGCIGMRYHSVVMQTILNGNNLVFDYTDPNSGKITGFLDMIGGQKFYADRKVCLKALENSELKKIGERLYDNSEFVYQASHMQQMYVAFLKEL